MSTTLLFQIQIVLILLIPIFGAPNQHRRPLFYVNLIVLTQWCVVSFSEFHLFVHECLDDDHVLYLQFLLRLLPLLLFSLQSLLFFTNI